MENKDHIIKAKPEFMPVDLRADSMQRTYALERRKEMLTCYIAQCDKYFRMLFYINLLHNNNKILPNIRISNELIQHKLIWLNYLPCEFTFCITIYVKRQSLGYLIVGLFY